MTLIQTVQSAFHIVPIVLAFFAGVIFESDDRKLAPALIMLFALFLQISLILFPRIL